MNKLTKKEIKEKFSKICRNEKIVDIDLYEDGEQARVITIHNHIVQDYTLTVQGDEILMWFGIMGSDKFDSEPIKCCR